MPPPQSDSVAGLPPSRLDRYQFLLKPLLILLTAAVLGVWAAEGKSLIAN
jgi:hypothetical protein